MALPEGLCPVIKDPTSFPQILLCFKSKTDKKKDKDKEDKDKHDKGKHDKDKHKDKKDKKKEDEEKDVFRKPKKKRAKSRELRGGRLYIGCDCERRNGLQDQCPRTWCQGSPECMTVPPTCLPSEFAGGKHIIAYFEAIIAARAEFKKKLGEKYGPEKYKDKEKKDKEKKDKEKGKGKDEKIDYDCFPLDMLILEGLPCPICNKPIENCFQELKKDDKKEEKKAPFTVDLTSGCLCCPAAC